MSTWLGGEGMRSARRKKEWNGKERKRTKKEKRGENGNWGGGCVTGFRGIDAPGFLSTHRAAFQERCARTWNSLP